MREAKILVVEDEAIVAQDIDGQLRKLGYQVIGLAFSGEDAVFQTVATRPDLVLMDIHLRGEMDGIEAAEKIRMFHDIPVIYLTAYSDDETLQRARVTEPFGYLLKPFVLRELHSTIEMALHKHQAERRLKESEAKFRTLAEANPAMIVIAQISQVDPKWQLIYSNPATEIITGYTDEEFDLLSQFELFHPDFHGIVMETIHAVLANQHHSIHTEIKILTKKQDERWLDCTFDQIDYYDREAVLLTAFDITDRKQAEQQRLELAAERERLKMFRHLVDDTAHDLRTPLTTIRTSVYLLQNLPEDSPKRSRYLSVLEEQTDHMEHVLNNMFQLARLDTTSEINLEPVNLNTLVQTIVAGHELAFQSKNHYQTVRFIPEIPMVVADKTLLTRAIANILLNAVNYTPEEGVITIQSVEEKGYVGIEISDTGIGISPADLPHIFERFYRADKSRNTNYGGAGLGLAIAQKAVKMHGGKIEVESLLGKGSTFRILLPINRVVADHSCEVPASSPEQHLPFPGGRIS